MIEPKHIVLEETAEVLSRRLDVIQAKKFTHQSDIRAASEFHPLCTVGNTKLRCEYLRERLDARATGVDERAIDVEEDEFDHLAERLDGGFEARDIRDIEHLRFLIDALHEAGQCRARPQLD